MPLAAGMQNSSGWASLSGNMNFKSFELRELGNTNLSQRAGAGARAHQRRERVQVAAAHQHSNAGRNFNKLK